MIVPSGTNETRNVETNDGEERTGKGKRERDEELTDNEEEKKNRGRGKEEISYNRQSNKLNLL